MPRLELANLLRPQTTPEQEIFLTWFYSQFDNRSAVNRRIVNVEPLYYSDVIGGTEFLTYAATKLYIVYNVTFDSGSAGIVANTAGAIQLNNEADTAINLYINNYPVWDTTAVALKYSIGLLELKNLYFSRIITTVYTRMKFNGYRITLQ